MFGKLSKILIEKLQENSATCAKLVLKRESQRLLCHSFLVISGRFQWHLQIFMEHIIGKDIDVSFGRLYQVGF